MKLRTIAAGVVVAALIGFVIGFLLMRARDIAACKRACRTTAVTVDGALGCGCITIQWTPFPRE